jgi:hypothetical protein
VRNATRFPFVAKENMLLLRYLLVIKPVRESASWRGIALAAPSRGSYAAMLYSYANKAKIQKKLSLRWDVDGQPIYRRKSNALQNPESAEFVNHTREINIVAGHVVNRRDSL